MDYFDDVCIYFLGKDSIPAYIFNGGTESSRTNILNCVLKMSGGLTGLGQHEGESLMR